MTSPVRVGVVGAGAKGRAAMAAYATVSGVELVAVCDLDPARAQDAARAASIPHVEPDARSLVRRPELDLVYVATLPPSHHEIVLDAVAHGKHVLCEKPMAMSVAEAAEMRDAARDAGVVGALGYYHRFDPAPAIARALLRDGGVGEVRLVTITIAADFATHPGMPPQSAHWSTRLASGGGLVAQYLTHHLDLARFLLGEIDLVGGLARNLIPERPVAVPPGGSSGGLTEDVDGDDVAVGFGTAGRGLLAFGATWAAATPAETRWDIVGSDATLRLEGSAYPDRVSVARLGEAFSPVELETPRMSSDAALMTDVVAFINGGSDAPRFATFDDGVRAHELMGQLHPG